MTESTPTIQHLAGLAEFERREALETLVVAEFKATLLMVEDEELPLTESYFELGFTSLRITEVKQRLEDLLGRGISTNLLFNSPTVEQLIAHLIEDVLADLFAADEMSGGPAEGTGAGQQALFDELMQDLY